MANQDRISEVYRGHLWSPQVQERTRRRVDWMVGCAVGDVLDVGCSQGIVSLLLARRGHTVLGIDIEAERVTYAQADAQLEPPEVRARLNFQQADASRLPLTDDSVDTVMLGEVIEHLDDVGPVIREATRVLRPGGVLVITTPSGYSPHHDHRGSFFASTALTILAPLVAVRHLSVVDGYIRILANPGTTSQLEQHRLLVAALPHVEEQMFLVQKSLHRARVRLKPQVESNPDGERRAQLEEELAAAEARIRHLQAAVFGLRESWRCERLTAVAKASANNLRSASSLPLDRVFPDREPPTKAGLASRSPASPEAEELRRLRRALAAYDRSRYLRLRRAVMRGVRGSSWSRILRGVVRAVRR